jgi:CelD/BcsL family acetyltransferase involved in cellulose biosynthesis
MSQTDLATGAGLTAPKQQTLPHLLGFGEVADTALTSSVSASRIDPRDYAAMVRSFEDLASRANAANPFMSPAAVTAAAERFGFDTLCVVVAQEGGSPRGKLMGAWVFRRQRDLWSFGVEVLQTPATPLFDTSAAPVLDRTREADARKAIIAALKNDPDLPKVIRATSLPEPELSAIAAYTSVTMAERWTRATLDGVLTNAPEDVLQAMLGGAYKKRIRAEQALGRLGRFRHETWRGADAAAGFGLFVELEDKGWKGKGGTSLKRNPRDLAYVRSLAARLADEDAFAVDALMLDDRPIAIGLLPDRAGGAVFWKTAFDEDFAKHSPGVLLDIAVTRRMLREGRPHLDSGMMEFTDPDSQIWPGRAAYARAAIDFSGGMPGLLVRAGKRLRHTMRLMRRSLPHS